ncbi:hypothetical protein POM88_019208 [Heracleum sosnowskyi]|uniref:Uncharacterized protein n=1 Tax=Heracleum sosnowskyi TaxID=360622 RepID=A0AAD8IVS8_9APIA|nr:hypothetical protein POM88_019208 [Heracleum sosnowskyi]
MCRKKPENPRVCPKRIQRQLKEMAFSNYRVFIAATVGHALLLLGKESHLLTTHVYGKSSDVISNGIEWEKKLDSFWKERLKGQDPLEVMGAKETKDAMVNL